MLAALAGVIGIPLAAETLRIESVWCVEAPQTDGKLSDWSSPMVSLGSAPVSMGVRNDGQVLHVALVASDPSARRVLAAAGFTLWWDPAGKDKKRDGIAIPPVASIGRWMGGPSSGRPAQPTSGGDPQEGQPQAGRAEPPIQPISHVEVAGPGKEDRRRLELAYARTIGIDVAARLDEGVLVYEIRIPLAPTEAQPYAVRSAPGGTIGLGIESNQLPRPAGRDEGGRRGGMGGAPPGGGGGAGGGMSGGGGRGGMMGGAPPEGGRGGMPDAKPIKAWTVVHLAKGPA